MSVIKGKDMVLYFSLEGQEQVVACFQSCTLNTIANIGETSTYNSGKWRTFKGVSLEWDGTCSGLCSLDSNWSIGTMRTAQFTLQPVDIRFVSTDPNGLTELFSSRCIITNVSNSGSYSNGASNYTVDIKGIGELASELPPVIPEGCTLHWYYYVATGGEFTTGSIADLIGHDIDGGIYRDGVFYIPSGPNHDGSTAPSPTAKEFSYNPVTGSIGFSDALPPLTAGEQLAIPYIVCEEEETPPDCAPVQIDNVQIPDGDLGVPYDFAISLFGDAPFSKAPGEVKPTWMTITVDGSLVRLTGTPNVAATDLQVSFIITNCNGANTDPFSDTIDVTTPGDAHFINTTFVSADQFDDVEIANIAGIPGSIVTVTYDSVVNTNGGVVEVEGTDAFPGNMWMVTMDGTGHGSLDIAIRGENVPGTTIINAIFLITAVNTGTIGTPDTFHISKAITA